MQQHELWQEFKAYAARVIATHTTLTTEQAERLTAALAAALQEAWGGMSVYFPRDDAHRRAKRDAAILAAYDGKPETINRLAREHNLTEVYVYRVIKQQRSAERTRRNGRGHTA
jgi:Mor family transcriptional regulator